jgi:hypothetical protein
MRRSFHPSYGKYKATPLAKPPTDRRAWLAMLERAAEAVTGDPTARPLDFAASLKGLNGDNFPVGATDGRRRWAKIFVEQARLWVDAGPATRTAFAPALAIEAKALTDILIEQGAAEAAASRERMGFRED